MGSILSVIVLVLIVSGIAYWSEIESIAFIVVALVLVVAIPGFFIVEYRKKIKRISYLEDKLIENHIPFDHED